MADYDLGLDIEQIMSAELPGDVTMGDDEVQVVDAGKATANVDHGENGLPYQVEEEEDYEEEVIPTRVTFVDHLKSPIIQLLIGEGNEQTILTAHQALLVRSPFFEEACAGFSETTLVG